jgi:cellulose synthase/poly-beta-1,6-N-acetylglucosamine synthase-like glycosyltransferase
MTIVFMLGFLIFAPELWRLALILAGISTTHRAGYHIQGKENSYPPERDRKPGSGSPRIALLYLVCDDFDPEACSTLLEQEGVASEIFVLDDSELLKSRSEIDCWASCQEVHIEVVRRAGRKNFKSGSLNNWLYLHGQSGRFEYFLLADADTYLTHNFTSTLLALLQPSPLAFAQGVHRSSLKAASSFQRLLSRRVDCAWRFEIPIQGFTGIPLMLGHGVLIRTSAAQQIGGFPNFISEDIAFTLRLASQGNYGATVTDAIATEGYPISYYSYWRRMLRWTRADADIVRRLSNPLLESRMRPLRKVAVWAGLIRLPSASFYWPLLVAASTLSLLGAGNSIAECAFIWIALPMVLAPALPVLFLQRTSGLEKVRFVLASGFLAAATACLPTVGTLQGFFGRYLTWEPTARTARQRTSPGWGILESFTGVLCVAAGTMSCNLVLCAVGVALACSPVMRTRHEILALCIGVTLFWILIIIQFVLDAFGNQAPVLHLVVLLGIAPLI